MWERSLRAWRRALREGRSYDAESPAIVAALRRYDRRRRHGGGLSGLADESGGASGDLRSALAGGQSTRRAHGRFRRRGRRLRDAGVSSERRRSASSRAARLQNLDLYAGRAGGAGVRGARRPAGAAGSRRDPGTTGLFPRRRAADRRGGRARACSVAAGGGEYRGRFAGRAGGRTGGAGRRGGRPWRRRDGGRRQPHRHRRGDAGQSGFRRRPVDMQRMADGGELTPRDVTCARRRAAFDLYRGAAARRRRFVSAGRKSKGLISPRVLFAERFQRPI